MNGFDIKPNMDPALQTQCCRSERFDSKQTRTLKKNKLKDDLSVNAYTIAYDLGFKTSLDNLKMTRHLLYLKSHSLNERCWERAVERRWFVKWKLLTIQYCVFQQHHRGQKQDSSGNDKMNMPYILNRTLPN